MDIYILYLYHLFFPFIVPTKRPIIVKVQLLTDIYAVKFVLKRTTLRIRIFENKNIITTQNEYRTLLSHSQVIR